MAWLKKYKGYIVHGIAVAIVFASPSVRAALAAHPDFSALGGLAWGYVLHWAQGKD